MNRMLATLISTCGVGFSPVAPGTVGSAFALVAGYIIIDRFGWEECFYAFVAVTVIGVLATRAYLKHHPEKQDPKEVVIDEVAGQWLTLLCPILFLHLITWLQMGSLHIIALERDWVGIYFCLAFVLFRLFDIMKPWPISFVDRRMKSALGVMLDDLLAGFMAGVLLYVMYIVGPLVMGTEAETM